MLELSKLDFSQLRVSEMIEYFTMVGNICRKYDPVTMNVEPQWNALTQSVTKAESSFNLDASSPITAELISLDQVRDNDTICLRTLADGYTYHYSPEKKAAAKLIMKTINLYGSKIYSLNYEAQTAVLRNLTNDLLLKPELVSALETLGILDVAEKMRDNNLAFSEKYLARIEGTANKSSVSAGEVLKETISLYRLLARHLEARVLVDSNDNLTNTFAEINKLTERFNTIIKNRQGSGKGIQQQPEQPAGEMA